MNKWVDQISSIKAIAHLCCCLPWGELTLSFVSVLSDDLKYNYIHIYILFLQNNSCARGFRHGSRSSSWAVNVIICCQWESLVWTRPPKSSHIVGQFPANHSQGAHAGAHSLPVCSQEPHAGAHSLPLRTKLEAYFVSVKFDLGKVPVPFSLLYWVQLLKN